MTSEPRRFGLLIGVGEYPRIGESARLLGPAQDVRALKRVLVRSYGFDPEDLQTLLDAEATREAILGGLDRLVAEARDGDQVVIHFSGHGSQVADVHGDEPDGLDETLVPSDARRDGWEFSGDISDHEIARRLAALEKRGAFVTLNLDCCHSGHVHRNQASVRVRRLMPPHPIPGSPTRRGGPDGSLSGSSSWLKHGIARRRLILAACRDDQLAGEREIGGLCFGEWTWAWVQALEQAEPGTVAREVFQRAAEALASAGGSQWPVLLGDGERKIFGSHRPDFVRHLTAHRQTDDSWKLEGGAALGLVLGSRWTLVPVDTLSAGPASTFSVGGGGAADGFPSWGPLRLSDIGPFESVLRLEDGARSPVEDRKTLWALELEAAYGDRRLPVSMPEPSAPPWVLGPDEPLDWQDLRKRVRSSPYLREVERPVSPGSAGYPGPSTSASGFWNAERGVQIQRDGSLVDHLGSPLLLEPVLGSKARQEAVLERLERRARARLGLRLENRDPESRLERLFDFRLLRQDPQGGWQPAHCDDGFSAAFRTGELLAMDLLHQYSDGLYIYVIDFGLNDGVTQIYPEPGGAELLMPGLQLSIGKQEHDELELVFPSQSTANGAGPSPTEPPVQGLGVVKAFATTSPTDFSWITSSSGEPQPHRRANRLESLLSLGRVEPSLRHRDDWTCLQKTIRLYSR